MEPNADVLMRLVHLVYAAAQDDRGWEPFLTALADGVRGQCAALLSHNLNRVGSVAAAARMDPEIMSAYNQHFHVHDSFALSLRARPAEQRSGVFTGEMLVPRSELLRTEFGHDFGVAFDITRMMTAIAQSADCDSSSPLTGVTILRREQDWSFDQSERLLFQAVFPHLLRALAIRRRLRAAEQTERTLGGVFELLPTPAMVVDGRARVLRANRRADQLLTRGDGLSIAQGVLTSPMSDDTSRLRTACAAAARPDLQHEPPGETLTIRRPLSVSPLRLIISPLPRVVDPLSMAADRASALVLVDEPELGKEPDVQLLRRLYGLTQAEAEIAARIAVGDALDQIAVSRHCALQTVQWHNKRILSKMGCSSRRELVRLLTLSLASLVADD